MTFCTVGYGDFYPISVPECLVASLAMIVNIVVGAYIIGIITLLILRGDEEKGRLREKMRTVKQYSDDMRLPRELRRTMESYTQLAFYHSSVTDANVLADMPTAIARRVLRYRYLSTLQSCYLFQGVAPKFLDALLAVGCIEMFMPQEEIMAAGSNILDLHIVLGGRVSLGAALDKASGSASLHAKADKRAMAERAAKALQHQSSLSDAQASELASTWAVPLDDDADAAPAVLGPGSVPGDVAFFTEMPLMKAVWSQSMVQLLVITHDARCARSSRCRHAACCVHCRSRRTRRWLRSCPAPRSPRRSLTAWRWLKAAARRERRQPWS